MNRQRFVNILVVLFAGLLVVTRRVSGAEYVRTTHTYTAYTIQELERQMKDRIVEWKLRVVQNNAPNTVLWEITIHDLPVDLKDCQEMDVMFFNEYSNPDWKDIVYNKCLHTGPEFLAFDERLGRLYFYVSAGVGGGTSVLPSMSYVADLGRRSIERFMIIAGHPGGLLSPSGRYLALTGGKIIDVFDTSTKGRVVTIRPTEQEEREAKALGKRCVIRFKSARWLQEDQIAFVQAILKDKAAEDSVSEVNKVFDISTQK